MKSFQQTHSLVIEPSVVRLVSNWLPTRGLEGRMMTWSWSKIWILSLVQLGYYHRRRRVRAAGLAASRESVLALAGSEHDSLALVLSPSEDASITSNRTHLAHLTRS